MNENIFKIKDGVLVEVLDKNITEAVIPNSVTSIGYFAFRDCTSLTSVTIPDSVISIGWRAFENCTSLTNIIIPDSVIRIGSSAFYNTRYYNNADNRENNVLYIGNYLIDASYYCYNEDTDEGKSFEVSGDYKIKDGTKVIADSAFYYCTSLESVTIPDSVTSIGEDAFSDCRSLTSITIPDSVTSIGGGAFSGCRSLTSITIPDSVTSIGSNTFLDCASLTSITIPNSVTSIGIGAFYNCKALKSKKSNYKAFDFKSGNLFCKDYQFDLNEWSKEKHDIKPCVRGYHYCTNLFEIFNYYYGKIDEDIAIYECEIGDKVIKTETSKCCANKIKPVKRLYKEDVIKLLNV